MVFVCRDYCFASEDLTGMVQPLLGVNMVIAARCVHYVYYGLLLLIASARNCGKQLLVITLLIVKSAQSIVSV